MLTRDKLNKEDIALIDKLSNMLDSEISERVFYLAMNPENFRKIEVEIWSMLGNSALPYYNTEYFEYLAKEYEAKDKHDMWSARLYNCDLIYMQAIAHILEMPIPKDSGDCLE